jgi:hypothetical protein
VRASARIVSYHDANEAARTELVQAMEERVVLVTTLQTVRVRPGYRLVTATFEAGIR